MKTNEKGFTLIEVLIAISILSFGLLAIASMQVSSINGNAAANDITEGTTWASDRVETLIRLGAANYDDPAALLDTNGDGNGGLSDTGASADYTDTEGDYTISWNVAEDVVLTGTKTINVIVTWVKKGVSRSVALGYLIPEI